MYELRRRVQRFVRRALYVRRCSLRNGERYRDRHSRVSQRATGPQLGKIRLGKIQFDKIRLGEIRLGKTPLVVDALK
jgi:hypothetical protein